MINPIDQFYPGLRVWVMFLRQGDSWAILVFDRNVSTTVPVYTASANSFAMKKIIDLSNQQNCFYLPAMTSEQVIEWGLNGNPPEGYKTGFFVYDGVDSKNET